MESTSKISISEKIYAFLTVFFLIFGAIIALLTKKNNEYIIFYTRQSFALFCMILLAGIASSLMGATLLLFSCALNYFLATEVIIVAPLGWASVITINLGVVFLWIASLVASLSGKKKDIPLISALAKKLPI